ncbi:MAG: VWA domain-containing protein [Campylobacterales bacterium]|nr:VWA domain-containing protein [Campylobacterales bacterium]
MPELFIVFDASGSMWGQIDSIAKIESSKKILTEVLPTFPAQMPIGLMVYGHRDKSSCSDIELMQPLGLANRDAIVRHIQALRPLGKTPMIDAVAQAFGHFAQTEGQKIVILLSDGIETCHPDPCAQMQQLHATHPKSIVHVIGFGVDEAAAKQLECLAQAGSGRYFHAQDAHKLSAALSELNTSMTQSVAQVTSVSKSAKSSLGKLRITMPPESQKSLAFASIFAAQSDTPKKTIEQPANDTLHPLPSGSYRIALGYANPNYRPATDLNLTTLEVIGGEERILALGALGFNRAPSLQKLPVAAVEIRSRTSDLTLQLQEHGNDYYLYLPKPLPQGTYDVAFRYKQSQEATPVAYGVNLMASQTAQVEIDTSFRMLKPKDAKEWVGWELIDTQNNRSVLKLTRRWDNDFPLWNTFALPAGTYKVMVWLKGMDEALEAAEALEIKKGESIEFESGM